jgi:ATP-dependent Lhr-like helicase
MGRSGRRGQAAVIRMYVSEAEITPATSILDCLRISLVQSIAVLSLLIEGWCEPPAGDAMHLSTMVQQVLSVIAQYGGAGAPFLYSLLCQSGPFKSVTKAQFATFLHGLADHELISQTSDGTIMLGGRGESLVNHYSFYAAFSTPEEYRVFHKGKLLGSLPVDSQVIPGSYLIFAGRRWRIEDVDAERKVIDLSPSKGGRVPIFTGNGPIVHDRVRVKMVEIYQGDWVPEFLDRPARQMLCEAREAYARFELATTPLIRSGADTYVFHWAGDRVGRTLALVLAFNGIKAMDAGPALLAPDSDKSQIARALAAEPVDNPLLLMEFVPGARIEKFDRYVDKDLLAEGYVSRMLDLPGACQAARRITEMLERPHTSAP